MQTERSKSICIFFKWINKRPKIKTSRGPALYYEQTTWISQPSTPTIYFSIHSFCHDIKLAFETSSDVKQVWKKERKKERKKEK